MICRHCGSATTIRNGKSGSVQRFHCRSCQRYFRACPPKFSRDVKAMAVDMHLNNVGIRKIARFVGAAPATVIAWIRKAHEAMMASKSTAAHTDTVADIIEMDEIYTFVQKNGSAPLSGRPIPAVGAASSPTISPIPA